MSKYLLATLVAGMVVAGWLQLRGPSDQQASAQEDPFGGPSPASSDPFGAPSPATNTGNRDAADNPFGAGPKEPKRSKRKKPRASDDPFGSAERKTEPPRPKKAQASDDPFNGPAEPKPGPSKRKKAGASGDPFGAPAEPKTRPSGRKKPQVSPARDQAPCQAYPCIAVEPSADRAARARIETVLAREAQGFDFLDEPLGEVIDDIEFRHDIGIVIDTKALKDAGIDIAAPVTLSLEGVTLRSALRLMLRPFDLTYRIRNEVLQITTPEQAQSSLTSKLYPVSELLPDDGQAKCLMDLIQSVVAPQSWESAGGPGRILVLEHLKVLAISQTEDVFPEIDSLFSVLQQVAEKGD